LSYGNPANRNRHEQEASSAIHFVERQVGEYFERHLGYRPGIRVDSEYYYDDEGNPSRVLELVAPTTPRRLLRFAVQRNKRSRKWKWELDFDDFVEGRRVNEYHAEATAPLDFKSEIISVLDGYNLKF